MLIPDDVSGIASEQEKGKGKRRQPKLLSKSMWPAYSHPQSRRKYMLMFKLVQRLYYFLEVSVHKYSVVTKWFEVMHNFLPLYL